MSGNKKLQWLNYVSDLLNLYQLRAVNSIANIDTKVEIAKRYLIRNMKRDTRSASLFVR